MLASWRVCLSGCGDLWQKAAIPNGRVRPHGLERMSNLTLIERASVMRLAMAQVRRRSVAGLLGSPLLRWRYGAPIAEALAMVPQELRLADPSFHAEIAQGQFGLAHTPAFVGHGTPYDITPPNEAWARELHGFGWLRHLTSAAEDEATARARALVKEWIGYGEARHDAAWLPEVVGRRIISWMSFTRLSHCLLVAMPRLRAS